MNGISAADAQALVPYLGAANTKVTDLYVDETLPRALFVQLERTGALTTGKNKTAPKPKKAAA